MTKNEIMETIMNNREAESKLTTSLYDVLRFMDSMTNGRERATQVINKLSEIAHFDSNIDSASVKIENLARLAMNDWVHDGNFEMTDDVKQNVEETFVVMKRAFNVYYATVLALNITNITLAKKLEEMEEG
nr:MAG TPA: hypothetical protein [Caudoviricetes sp.]